MRPSYINQLNPIDHPFRTAELNFYPSGNIDRVNDNKRQSNRISVPMKFVAIGVHWWFDLRRLGIVQKQLPDSRVPRLKLETLFSLRSPS